MVNRREKKTPFKINMKLLRLGGIIFFVLLLIGGVYMWYKRRYSGFIEFYNNYQPALAPGDTLSEIVELSENKSFNVLLLGLDQRESGHIKADAVFIIHFDSISKHFQVFELPSKAKYYWSKKDEYIELANIYALGQLQSPEAGYSIIQDVLESNLAIKIDAYVASDIAGFKQVIKDMGNLSIQNDESFTDNDLESFDLRPDFPSGPLHLSANETVAFVRADENGFYSKSFRHYAVMRSLIESVNVSSLYSPLGTFEDIDEHIYSNIQGASIRHFIKLFANENTFTFDFYQVGIVLSKSPEVEGEVFDPLKFDDFVSSTFDNGEVVREQARIEVYNSTSIPGLASRYTRVLQNMGCDIIRKSNTGTDVSKTMIFAENPELFPLTIAQIKNAFEVDVEVINDSLDFVTTGDLIIVLADDVETI